MPNDSDTDILTITLEDQTVKIKLPNESDYIQSFIRRNQIFYERDVLDQIAAITLPAGAIVDAGANIGNHSLYFSVIMGRSVIAVEPYAPAHEVLEENIAINGLGDSVQIVGAALGGAAGRGRMLLSDGDNIGAARFVPDDNGPVSVRTIDDIATDTRVALIKIDVEGSELDVLSGAAETINRCRPVVVVEVHGWGRFRDVVGRFDGLDYRVFGIKGRTPTIFILPREVLQAHRMLVDPVFEMRNDMFEMGRALKGSLDRVERLQNSYAQALESQREALEPMKAGADQLAQSVDASVAELRALDRRFPEIERQMIDLAAHATDMVARLREIDGRAADLAAETGEGIAAIHAHLQEHTSKLDQVTEQWLSTHGDTRRLVESGLVAIGETQEKMRDSLARLDVDQDRLFEGITALTATQAEQGTQLHDRQDRILGSVSELAVGQTVIRDRLEHVARAQDRVLNRLSNSTSRLRRDLIDATRSHGEALSKKLASDLAAIRTLAQAAMDENRKTVSEQLSPMATEQAAIRKDIAGLGDQTSALGRGLDDLRSRLAEARISDAALAESKVRLALEGMRSRMLADRLKIIYASHTLKIGKAVRAILRLASLGRIRQVETWQTYESYLEAMIEEEEQRLRTIVPAPPPSAPAERPIPEPSRPEEPAAMVPPRQASGSLARRLHIANPERIVAGVASMALREKGLEQVIACIAPQVDELYVYLNDYEEAPSFLRRPNIRICQFEGDLGDRGKFKQVDESEGYYFSLDDDIFYPPYYVEHCIDGIERYGRKAAVGWHGSVLKFPFENYYSAESRRVFAFGSGRPDDTGVHILGTGCAAFHTSTIRVRFNDFKKPNMADVYFALLGQAQKVPFIVLKHFAKEARPIEIADDKQINRESMRKTGSEADTRVDQNRLVKSHGDWTIFPAERRYRRRLRDIAYVGRLDHERWRKGGILKSGHLIVNAMKALGHYVRAIEIEQSTESMLSAIEGAEIVWIYPGDPERPDFQPVITLIEHARAKGQKVIINLSFNRIPDRTRWIIDHIKAWNAERPGSVYLSLFTNTGRDLEEFETIKSHLICTPKTIEFPDRPIAPFEETEGIFLGDLQKLLDTKLVEGQIEPWLEAARSALPGVKFYAVRQYGGKVSRDLGLHVVPYMTQGWSDWLAQRRIACCLITHATFEMIPLEAGGLGIPCIYRPMVQSLSEYVGISGISVSTPAEFGTAVRALYYDKHLWTKLSTSAAHRARSQVTSATSAVTHINLEALWADERVRN